LGALVLIPASAEAQFVLPWWSEPIITEADARAIAMQNGMATVEEVDLELDGDWEVDGLMANGRELELEIDGQSGAINDRDEDVDWPF
jgi:uncharacterized membrane protein YkoI